MKFNSPFIMVLTGVWLILLALCALIGALIVPVSSDISSEWVIIAIAAGKVGISLLAILIWLFGWYKSMDYLLKIEFYLGETTETTEN